ncbi:hypothetical protein [Absidia glauca]|uniref:BHLH domain-containing protein n=1 Tax=Absidia glauca TaxID=4829 RepID=A0A163JKR1_ABSGL|nr:hypothetical protein [Absidia glauca]
MDFGSFDLDDSKPTSIKRTFSHNNATYDQDASDFFDFIDSTHFHSVNTQQCHQQPAQDSHASVHDMSAFSSTSKDAQTSATNGTDNNGYSLLSPHPMNPNGYDTPLQHPINPEDEEFFTPLISPTIPPNYYTNLRSDTNFSPLTSPALQPQREGTTSQHTQQQQTYHMNQYSTTGLNSSSSSMHEVQSPEELQERLAMIERQQQQLRSHMQQQSAGSSSPGLYSSPAMASPVHSATTTTNYGNLLTVTNNSTSSTTKHKQTLRHQIAMSSPQFNPTITHMRSPGMHPPQQNNNNNPSNVNMSPATPSLLMKLGNGMHRTNNHANSPSSTLPSSQDSNIDNMMILPDAILPPSDNSKKPVKKTSISSSTSTSTKKRRISYPRSAFTPPALLPSTSSSSSAYPHRHYGNPDMASFDPGIAALVSPAALRPFTPLSPGMVVSPNNMSASSPRALKPLISPSLKPNSSMDEQDAAAILASKSNYQALREGQAKSLGIDFNTNIQSGMENRRSAHKAAEQRRRDTLKQNFDCLRGELLEALVEEERLVDQEDDGVDREKKVKQMSKVVLLQHSYEYILRLKADHRQKDAKMDKMTKEIQRLRAQLGMPAVTDEERLALEEEKRLEKEKRLARLKRLEEMVDG